MEAIPCRFLKETSCLVFVQLFLAVFFPCPLYGRNSSPLFRRSFPLLLRDGYLFGSLAVRCKVNSADGTEFDISLLMRVNLSFVTAYKISTKETSLSIVVGSIVKFVAFLTVETASIEFY